MCRTDGKGVLLLLFNYYYYCEFCADLSQELGWQHMAVN